MLKWKSWEMKHTISMKLLLFLLLVLVGVLPMMANGFVLISSLKQVQIEGQMMKLQNQCLILSNKLTRSGYMTADTPDAILSGEMDTVSDLFNGRIVVVDKNFKIVKDTFNLAEGKTNVSEEIIRGFQGDSKSKRYKNGRYISLTAPIYDNTPEKHIIGVMLVTASTEDITSITDRIAEKSSFFQMMVMWILMLAAFVCVRLFMRPFHRLQKVLDRVAEGNLDEDISENIYKETKGISSAINKTLTKLKTVDQSREEFVSNVSHELKTPITSIRVLADSLMSMEEVPLELYREFMSDISDEIDRESKIIDDLLSLVRMDKSTTEINVEQVDINRLLKLILKRIQPIAQKRNIDLIFESIREVTADVDEVKLSLAMNNLIENAVKYNINGGWVRVTLDADHKFFYVKVADSGIGIPEDVQEHIFERFYRVDKARSRGTGGTGLGLSITKNVILMHKGVIKVISKEGEGASFSMRIPLNYIA